MTTQFSDFLAANAARIADLWFRQIQSISTEPVPPADSARGPRQFINAVVVGLSADDLRPLIAFYQLDQASAGLEGRLDRALRHLGSLRRATAQAAREEALDFETSLALALAAGDDLGTLARRLATGCMTALATQLASATSSSSVRGTSLSITMHELRRPLTILNSYGQLLATGMLGTLPETAVVAIEGITASTEMMVRMVNALAELARLEDPDDHLSLEAMDASEVVKGAVEHVAMEAKLREIEIEAQAEDGILINVDRRRMTLALTNLLGNAVKHGPPGSPIEISVQAHDGGAQFVVRVRAAISSTRPPE